METRKTTILFFKTFVSMISLLLLFAHFFRLLSYPSPPFIVLHWLLFRQFIFLKYGKLISLWPLTHVQACRMIIILWSHYLKIDVFAISRKLLNFSIVNPRKYLCPFDCLLHKERITTHEKDASSIWNRLFFTQHHQASPPLVYSFYLDRLPLIEQPSSQVTFSGIWMKGESFARFRWFLSMILFVAAISEGSPGILALKFLDETSFAFAWMHPTTNC